MTIVHHPRLSTPLKRARIARGLSQRQIAQDLSLNPATLSKLENGCFVPTAELARRLAVYFGHSVTELQILYPGDYMNSATTCAREA